MANARARAARPGSKGLRTARPSKLMPPRRSARYEEEPGYYEPAGLWLYGNSKLLHARLEYVALACGPSTHPPSTLDSIEREAEELVLGGAILVCGVHNPAHQRAAVVPLRWGSPRLIVLSGGFYHHLGKDLRQEPFRAARLWRYEFDPITDLVVSRRWPDRRPTFGLHNPTIDRLIARLANGECPGLCSVLDPLTPILAR